ncbi:MAG: hypothetical protein EOP04_25960 [Proteobacteria bacterium]|nr:MAG: hypothetical protein EOP04_25960 [Pseudomonadota bacterium]
MFFLAIELDDPDIIAMVVKQMSSRLWGVKEATSPIPSDSKILPYRSVTVKRPSFRAEVLLSVSGTHVCDLGGWSWATFDSTPKPILWAMLRARRAAQADGKVDRWSQMSGEIRKFWPRCVSYFTYLAPLIKL